MRSKLSALLASTLVAFATLAQAQPTITAQPTSASTASGWNTVTLSVTATASSGTLSYQWRKDGNNLVNTSVSNPPVTTTLPGGRAVDTIISGATGSALSITNAMVANSGSYTVVVTDSAGSVTSNAVTVTLTDVAPTVVAQSPASASVTAGGRAVLYITVNGSRPLNIQWKKNGVALGGVNGSSSTALELDQFSAAQAGTYTVDVSNAYGTATVQPMALQVAGQNDPFDTWRWSNPDPQGNNIISAISGAGKIVLVGRGGAVISTTDAQSGDVGTSGNGFNLASVAYDAATQKYFAVGGFSTIMSSTDAKSWTSKGLTGVDDGYNGIATDNSGAILLAGADFNLRPTRGLVRISRDGGNTWVLPDTVPAAFSSLTSSVQLTSATYGSGKFVVVGTGGLAFSSADAGHTWTQATTGTTQVLQGVGFGNGRYVAVGNNGTIRYSTDGMTFSTATSPTTQPLYSVSYLSSCSTWVAVGGAGTVLMSTDNGVTWTVPSGSLSNVPLDFYSVTENATITCIVGRNGRIFVRPVANTFNLAGWEEAGGNVQSDVSGSINYVDWDATTNQFIAVGQAGNVHSAGTDGMDWWRRATTTGNFLTQWTRFGGMLLASGSGGTVVTSNDGGFIWNSVATGAGAVQLNSIASGAGRVVTVGANGVIYTSTNGTTWTAATGGVTTILRRVAYANGRFIAVGGNDTGGTSITILTSDDGLTWTARTAATTGQLWGVDYANGKWIAAGAANINGGGAFVLTSTDNGVTWSRTDVGGMNFLYTIRYVAGRWIATGSPNFLAVSTDGTSWTLKSLPSVPNTNTQRGIAASPGGAAIVVGNDGTILTSAMFPPVITSQPAPATVAYNGGTFLSVSVNSPYQLSYQWRFNGVNIPGATNPGYFVSNFDANKQGNYDVVITATRNGDNNQIDTATTTSTAVTLTLGSGTAVTLPDWNFQPPHFWRHSLPGRLTAAPNGKIYATFSNGSSVNGVDGQLVGALIRLNSDGTLDNSFNIGTQLADAWAVVPLSDGRVLVGGVANDETNESGNTLYRVLRFNADGSRDWSYNSPVFTGVIRFMTLQPDGKLLVTPSSGAFTNNGGYSNVVRLNADGSRDFSFAIPNFNTVNPIFAPMVLDANNKIIIAGTFSTVNGTARPGVARLNTDGSLDTTFAPAGFTLGGGNQIRGVAVQTQGGNAGKIVITGGTIFVGGTPRPVVRLASDGSLDASFTLLNFNDVLGAAGVRPRLLNLLADDRLVLVSDKVVRLTADGALDGSYTAPVLSAEAFWIDTLADGSVLLPPEFGTTLGGATLTGPVRFGPTGARDTTFTTGKFQTAVYPTEFSVQSDGKIQVWGTFDTVNSTPRAGFARLNADGSLDSFTLSGVNNLYGVAAASVFSDGHILATTQQGTYQNNLSNSISRFNADGTLDSSFSLAAGVNAGNLRVLPDNSILTWTLSVNSLLNGGLSFQRLTGTGAVDASFTGLGSTVFGRVNRDGSNVITEIVQGIFNVVGHYADGRVLVIATSPNAAYAAGSSSLPVTILRLNANGTIDGTFNAPVLNWSTNVGFTTGILDPVRNVTGQWSLRTVNGSPFTGVVPQADGGAIVYGAFTSIGGVSAPGIARLTNTGAVDASFSVGTGPELRYRTDRFPWVQAISIAADGKIWVAGTFDTFGGRAAPGLARLNADGSVDSAFVSGAFYRQFLGNGSKIVFGANNSVYLSGTFVTQNNQPNGLTRLATQTAIGISNQPQNVTVTSGQSATLSVGVSGIGNLSFQWRRNGVAIAGANSWSYTIPNATRADADRYDVVVSDGTNTYVSTPAVLSVAPTAYPGVVGPDTSFNPNPLSLSSRVNYAVQLGDGKWFVAGDFTRWDATPRAFVAKLNADYSLDTGFVPPVFSGQVYAVAQAADGSIYVGGEFTRVDTHTFPGLVRLTATGAVDLAWTPQDSPQNASVVALAVTPDNKLMVARQSTLAGQVTTGGTNVLRRLNADGTLDGSFSVNLTTSGGRINSLVVEPSGAVAFGGVFTAVNGTTRYGVARVSATGALDSAFAGSTGASNAAAANTATSATVYSLTRASDGRYLVTGSFASIGGVDRNRSAILSASGSVDTAYVPVALNTGAVVLGGAIQSDGRVVLTGTFTTANAQTTYGMVRLTAAGAVDTVFTGGSPTSSSFQTSTALRSMFVYPQTDGSVALFGNFQSAFNQRRVGIAVVGANAQLTATAPIPYRPAFSNSVYVNPNGSVHLFGSIEVSGATTGLNQAALFNADGTVNSAFPIGTGFTSNGLSTFGIYRAARLSDGSFVAAGDFLGYNGNARARLLHLLKDGSFDSAYNPGGFGPGTGNTIVQLLPLSGGRVLLGGFTSFFYNNVAATGQLVRINADGSRDTNFTAQFSNGTSTSSVFLNGSYEQPDGKVVVAGGFAQYGAAGTTGTPSSGLARLNTDGSLDTSFAIGSGVTPGSVNFITGLPDGRIIVAGAFTTFNGTSVNRMVILSANGAIDSSFTAPSGLNAAVAQVIPQEDGKLLVFGDFTGTPAPYAVRLNANGTIDSSFALSGLTGGFGSASRVALGDDGSLYVFLNPHSVNYGAPVALSRFRGQPQAPTITAQPQSITAGLGGSFYFSVNAGGTGPHTYQWFINGQAIAGATSSVLRIANATAANIGNYTVTVTNAAGSVTSSVATVNSTTTALSQPASRRVVAGGKLLLRFGVSGNNIAYQWRKNGADIPGATSADYVVPAAQGSDAGTYTCYASNSLGNVTSDPATVTVVTPDAILWQQFTEYSAEAAPARLFRDGQGKVYLPWNVNDRNPDVAAGKLVGTLARFDETTGDYDPTFKLDRRYRRAAWMERQTDGKLLVAVGVGDSSTVIRTSATGSVDATFNAPLFGRGIRFIKLQSDGKVIVAAVDGVVSGNVATLGAAAPSIYRLNADGSLDNGFTPAVLNDFGNVFGPPEVDATGRIYLAGGFGTVNGTPRTNIARLNSDGSLDMTYAASLPAGFLSNQARAVAFQSDGRAVFVGDFRYTARGTLGNPIMAIRFNTDGSFDSDFAQPLMAELGLGFGRLRHLLVLSDDRIVAVGERVVRLSANGARDATFASFGMDREGFWIVRTADGRYLVPDVSWITVNSFPQPVWGNGVAAFTAEGQPDFSLQLGGYGRSQIIDSARVLSNGDVWLAGGFNRFGSAYLPGLGRFTSPTTLSATQSSGPAGATAAWQSLPGASIAAAASDQTYVLWNNTINRLNADATVDASFTPVLPAGYAVSASSAFAASGGKLVLAQGSVSASGALSGKTGDAMIRLNSNGSRDTSYVPNLSSFAVVERPTPSSAPTMIRTGGLNVAQILPDDRALVIVSAIDGTLKLQRLNADGSLDTSFNAPSFGTITPAVGFTTVLLDPVTNTSSQWSISNYSASDLVRTAVQMPDGKVYVGGRIALNGAPVGLVRLNADGSLDTTFTGAGIATTNADSGPYVSALTVDSAGRLYVAGRFTSFNGTTVPGLFRLLPNGTLDTAWSPGFGVVDAPYAAVTLQIANGRLYAFGTVGSAADALPVPYAPSVLSFPPAISAQPTSVTAADGSFVSLSVTASGQGTLTYQWYRNGNVITGASESSYTIPTVRSGDAGNYTVVVTSSAGGSVTSAIATIAVNASAPQFVAAGNISGTFGYVVPAGSSATLTANPSAGSLPITYQWRFNGSNIPGATGSTYTVTNWQPANQGAYSVVATNASGSATSPGDVFYVADDAGLRWRNPFPTGNGLTSSMFVNGRFFLGGVRGTLLTSTDGVTWTQANLAATNNIWSLAYGNGVYVGIGSLNALFYSLDGTNWEPAYTSIDPNAAGQLNEVVFANGRFAAVGSNGLTAVSIDGRNWTTGTLAAESTQNLGSLVTDPDNGFILLSSSNKIYESTDGVTWVYFATAPAQINSIALSTAETGGAVAVGDGGVIYSTNDGNTWTPRSSGITQDFVSVRYLNGQYVAVGLFGALATSPDGVAWTVRNSGTGSHLWSVTHGAGRYVIAGQSGNNGRNLLTSTDSITWSSSITGPYQGTHLNAVASNGTLAVAVGNGGAIATSNDLTTWTLRSSGTGLNLSDVAFGNGKFIAVAANTATLTASSDGITWTVQSTTGLSGGLVGIKHDGAKWIAAGNAGVIFTSTDGLAWTAQSSGVGVNLRKLATAGGTTAVVSQGGDILVTSTGTTWSRVVTSSGRPLTDVAVGNNTWVAVGNGGALLTSTNGTTWTNRTGVLPPTLLNSVNFVQGVFVVTTNNHAYFVSTDGVNWSGRFSGAFDALLDTVQHGNQMVGVGSFGTILTGGLATVPANRVVNAVVGQRVDLAAHVSATPLPSTYQWSKAGSPLSGATNYLHTIANVASSDAGDYSVVVGNNFGSTTHTITLVVNTPPTITTQPFSGTVPENGTTVLSVAANGSGALSYQWFKDGVAIAGATGTQFAATAPGSYTVQITSAYGTTTSSAAVLTSVPSAPVFPSIGAVNSAFGPVVIAGTSTYLQPQPTAGSRPMTFQWIKDGTDIPGATNEFYFLPNWQAQNAGSYSVRASNAQGSNVVASAERIDVTNEGGWRWRNPTPTGNGITRAAFLNGQFLLGGLRGTILTSSNGTAWTARTIPAQNNVFAFRYVNGRYVALASLNLVLTSLDGVSWTPRNVGLDGGVSALQDMAAGNDGRLVAVGTNGKTAVSSDGGLTWATGDIGSGNTDSLAGAIFVLNRYYAASLVNGRIYSSADGAAWSYVATSAPWLRSIAYGAGRLVAVGGGGAIYTSSNGSSWTPTTSGTTNDLLGVNFVNNQFVATGALGTLLTSPDGLTWTLRNTNGNQSNLQNVAFGNGRYVAAGQAGNTGRAIVTSTDGVNWANTIAGPRQGANLNAVAASGSTIVAVGNNGVIVSSTDNSTWTDRNSGVTNGSALNDVFYGGTKFVAVGNNGVVTVSNDGATWNLQAASGTIGTFGLNGVTYSASVNGAPGWVAVGGSGRIFTAADSVPFSWTTRGSRLTGNVLRKVIAANSQFVAVGFGGTILTSGDAVTWTARSSGTSANLNDVAYGGGAYVAVGNGGTVLRSTDAATWTSVPRFVAAAVQSVTYQNGSFIATCGGAGAPYYISTDGTNWSGRATGAFDPLLDTTSFANEIVGVGQFGTILTAGAPVIEPAANINANPATPVTLRFAVWNSAHAVTYVWTKNGNVIAGAANAPALTLPSVTSADAGDYVLAATNAFGTTTSQPIKLTLNVTIAIQTQPQPQTVVAGANATFTIAATGTPAPTYQWRFNGQPITGATSASFTLNNVKPTDAGLYSVVLTNAGGSITSDAAQLTVNPVAPLITSPLAAFAVANAPFRYQIATNQTLATFSASGLPTGLAIDPSTGVIGGTPTQVGTTDVTIRATNITGFDERTLSLTVQPPAPVITSAASVNARVGVPFSYTITATNSPTGFLAVALPPGLSLSGAVISGTPTAAGFYAASIVAQNATGVATQPLNITVQAALNAPVYTGATTSSGTAGTAFSFTPTFGGGVTNYALVNLPDGTASALPTGITLNASTGVISGTTTQTGTFKVAVRATNGDGATTQVLTFTFNPAATAPAVTSASATVGTVNSAFTFSITTAPAATSFASTALPAGLTLDAATGVISGTPTIPGITAVTLTVTNASGSSSSPLSITINSSALAPVITSAPVAPGTVGTVFSFALTASNSPTQFAVISGTLPAGLALDGATGALTGTPTAAGQAKVWVAASNSAGGRGPAVEMLFDIARALTVPVITSNGTAAGQVGQPFQYQVTATNAPTAYTASTLPPGLNFDSSTGVISGVPGAETTTPFVVTLGASNADGAAAPKTLAITIAPAAATPKITSALSAGGRVGTAFSYQITASESPTSYSSDQLPAGLTLDTATGLISGTPTAAGSTAVQIRAANAAGLGQASTLRIDIASALLAPAITSDPTAAGKVGVLFTYAITATGNPTSYAAAGTLPAGLSLNTSTGVISGNPSDVPGLFIVSLTASNSVGTSQPQSLTINLAPADNAPVITSPTTAVGTVGVAFSYQITATNVPITTPFPPSVFLDALGLPAGLAVNASTGLIQGKPSAAGTYMVSLVGVNTSGTGLPRTLTLTINPAPNAPVVTSADNASAQAGTPFSYQITATNSPTAFEALDTPAWLSINSATGLLAGTPTGPGTITVRLGASNSGGASTLVPLRLSIAAAPNTPVVTSGQLASGRVGQSFAYDIAATLAPTSYIVSGLPPGLTFDAATGQIRGTPTASGTFTMLVSGVNSNGQGQPVAVTVTIATSIQLIGG